MLLILSANIVYFYQNNDGDGRLYLVEAKRLVKEIEEQKPESSQIEAISLNKYETIVGIREFVAGEICDNDYLVEEIAGELYRIEYAQERSSRLALYMNISLLGMIIVTIIVLTYVYHKVLKPFQDMSNLSYELAKGNLSMPVKEEKSKLFGHFLWGMDMLREKLEDNKERELEFQKERKTLILSLSHDIKTPIATIKSCANALTEGLVPSEKVKEYYHIIDKKADRVKALSEDMFVMLKMDNPNYSLQLEKVDMCEYMRQLCAEHYDEITDTGFEFNVEIPDYRIDASLDKGLFPRVIENLLSNACKSNKSGKQITVKLEKREKLILAVRDDGEAVEPQFAMQMSQAFSRGDSARKTNGGTGLGLSIVQIIVQKHGGNIIYLRDGAENVFRIEL